MNKKLAEIREEIENRFLGIEVIPKDGSLYVYKGESDEDSEDIIIDIERLFTQDFYINAQEENMCSFNELLCTISNNMKKKIKTYVGNWTILDGTPIDELLVICKEIKASNKNIIIDLEYDDVNQNPIIQAYVIKEETDDEYNKRIISEESADFLVKKAEYQKAIQILKDTIKESFFDIEYIKKNILKIK